MRKVLVYEIAIVLGTLSVGPLFAQNKPTVCVLPFIAESVSKPEASTITRLFEAALVQTNAFTVVEQAEREQILKEQEFSQGDCSDEACAIEAGKLLSAQSIFIGTLSRIESTFYLTVKLIDVKQGKNLKSESRQDSTLSGLADSLKEVAESMMGVGVVTAGKASIIAEEENPAGGEQTATGVQASSCYVTFDSDPPGVSFSLFDNMGNVLAKGITSKAFRLSFGAVSVKAQDQAGLYYPYEGTLDVNAEAGRKFTYKIEMKPHFGGVVISSTPSGADVMKEGIGIGATPYTAQRLKSGTHTFVLAKPFYDSTTVTVTVEDEQKAQISADLLPAFVLLSVSEKNSQKGTVYIDGERIGSLPLARKQMAYRDFSLRVVPEDRRYGQLKEMVKVKKRGETIAKEIAFAGRKGLLNVETNPYCEGDIFVNGVKAGTAPDSLELLVGTYEVRVSGTIKGAQYSGTRSVTVAEGKEITLTVPISSEVFDAMTREVEEAGKSIAPQNTSLAQAIRSLTTLRSRVLSDENLSGSVELVARIDFLVSMGNTILSNQKTQTQINALESRKRALAGRLSGVNKSRAGWSAFGWISFSVCLAGGGLGGYSWYAAEDAFTRYQATPYSADAASLRSDVQLWDTVKVVSLSAGGAGLVLAILPLVFSPSSQGLERELASIDGEIQSLKGKLK